jgi:hypothetical protein
VKRLPCRGLTNSLQILHNFLTTFLLVPINLFNDEHVRRIKMKKTITLMGKGAEGYFNARCAFKIDLFEGGMADQNNLAWQKSLKDVNPHRMRLFSPELYPVLITEYKLNGKGPRSEGQTEMIMVDVIGDVM